MTLCPECDETVNGWIAVGRFQIVYCRNCTSFEDAMAEVGRRQKEWEKSHRWEYLRDRLLLKWWSSDFRERLFGPLVPGRGFLR